MKVKSESEVAQSCPTLCDLMDCSLWGSFIQEIFQARVLEWVAIAFSEEPAIGEGSPREAMTFSKECNHCRPTGRWGGGWRSIISSSLFSHSITFVAVHLCPTLCDPSDCSTPGFPVLLCPSSPGACSNSCPLSRWCHPTISSSVAPSPPVLNLSQHQGLFPASAPCIRWPKCWSFSLSISPSNGYSGLISFRVDWFDLLAVTYPHPKQPIKKFAGCHAFFMTTRDRVCL